MTTLRYCHIHGSFRADYPDSCPSCDLDEFGREQRAEARAANETYERNNPGDYTCPNCLYTTLKSGASRCPKCQGSVDADYWVRARADEKAKDLADQERERTRKAEEAAEEARERASEAKAAAEWERRAAAIPDPSSNDLSGKSSSVAPLFPLFLLAIGVATVVSLVALRGCLN